MTLFFLTAAVPCPAQTTQGVISGTITDQVSGRPLGAKIVCENTPSHLQRITNTSAAGDYAFTLLPPGIYRITVDAGPGYRPAQLYNLQLPVAGFLQQNFSLRLLTDLWQNGQPRSVVSKDGKTVLMFYGPDVDTSRTMAIEKDDGIHGSLEPSISQVVEPVLIDNLPLAGRDVYTMIALQPGVTSDTSTTRGLGISVNGQRPSSSNYLLDGLQNNKYLITGPLSIVPPEGIQEYRISTNNFSAEYGGTSGFLANAVTKSGSDRWHGDGYYYFKNEALDANDFQRNVQGLSRLPFRENQLGGQIGGPTSIRGLFTSTLVEYTRDQAWEDAAPFVFPTPAYIAGLSPSSLAAQILTRYQPPAGDAAGNALIRKPNIMNRTIALERMDYNPLSNKDRAFARLSIYRQSQPDFVWSPYPAFSSGLDSNTTALAASDTHVFGNTTTGEIRGSFETDLLGWRPPNQDVPALKVPGENLPGTPAHYFFQNHGKSGELNASLITIAGKHVLKMGGGWLGRWINGAITDPGSTLTYHFADLAAFAGDQPNSVDLATTRVAAAVNQYVEPQQDRTYRYNQLFLFAQDSVRITSRLLLHLGVRYDSFGSPINTGAAKDWLIQLGPGDSFPQRLATATMPQPSSSDEPLYSADYSNWAPRAGFAYNLQRNGRSVFRAAYGIFFDRPFDNLWLNISLNNAVPASARLSGTKLDYLQPPSVILAGNPVAANVALQPITFFQPRIRTPYAQSFFAGIQQALSARWSLDLNYSASLGRRLLTNDLVNRVDSICLNGRGTECRYNSTYNNDFDYRANQGGSDFHALTAATKIRARRGMIGVNYTWSHSIDNQSEPLAGLSTNLEVTGSSPISPRPAQFTEQFNSNGDRGSSDFDQRQSVTFYSTWNFNAPSARGRIASLVRDWQISQIGAIRSGQPYTVYVNSQSLSATHVMGVPGELLYNRANLVAASTTPQNAVGPSGGVLLFNPAAFANPVFALGSPGRNALTGPGLYSIDLSVSRSFALPRLSESARLLFRIDAYNAFNHANLNNPSLASSTCCLANNPDFGTAYYGRQDLGSTLPVISPRNETARQLQLMLKIAF